MSIIPCALGYLYILAFMCLGYFFAGSVISVYLLPYQLSVTALSKWRQPPIRYR